MTINIPVGLSTACVVPGSISGTSAIAQELGHDGIEIMVWSRKISQDTIRLAALVEKHDQLVLAVHAPTLLVTRGVFDADSWDKMDHSIKLVHYLETPTVVLHPPFFWQTRHAHSSTARVTQREAITGVHLAMESTPTWRPRHTHSACNFQAYSSTQDPVGQGYKSVTLDISHAATSGSDTLAIAHTLRLTLCHLHLTDDAPGPLDGRLLPGQGNRDCAGVSKYLVATGFGINGGQVVVEVTTRSMTVSQRLKGLASALAFIREHLEDGGPARIPESTRKHYRRS